MGPQLLISSLYSRDPMNAEGPVKGCLPRRGIEVWAFDMFEQL